MKLNTHIGVYALAQQGEKILLIEKSRGPYKGKMDLPGGGFEFGETPEETLKREVKEETGLSVLNQQLLNVVSHTETYQNENGEMETLHHIGILYRIEFRVGKLKDYSDGQDSLGAKWIAGSEINRADYSPFCLQIIPFLENI